MINLNSFMQNSDAFEIINNTNNTAIFGGFFRDLYTGRKPKDIDMLVTEQSKMEVLTKFLEKGWTITPTHDTDENFDPNYSANRHLVEVVKCYPPYRRDGAQIGDRNTYPVTVGNRSVPRSPAVDVLVINIPVEEYIRNIPIGSSQIGMTADGEIKGEHFDSFVNDRTLAVSTGLRPSYVQRIRQYYEDLSNGRLLNLVYIDSGDWFTPPQNPRQEGGEILFEDQSEASVAATGGELW